MNKKTKQKESLPPWFVAPERKNTSVRNDAPYGSRGWGHFSTQVEASSALLCTHPHGWIKTNTDRDDVGEKGWAHRIVIRFPNEYSLSVVYGTGMYSTNSKGNRFEKLELHSEEHATTVEIAIIDPRGEFLPFKNGETVKGFVTVPELLEIVNWISTQPAKHTQESVTTSNV